MKGIIIVNPYRIPIQSVSQAERLKEEFNKLGVTINVVTDGYALVKNNDKGSLSCAFNGIDFIIFLDKDKYLSALLSKSGVPVFNTHKAIRDCDDKGETVIALSGKGINMPKTLFAPVCYNQNALLEGDFIKTVIDELGLPVVVKESYGSMGKGVYKADTKEELKNLYNDLKTKPHIYQKYLGLRAGYDVRVIVIGGKCFCAMERVNPNDFRSNIALGGTGNYIDIDSPNFAEYKKVAEKTAEILGLDYCGVDLIIDDDGTPAICEVNSNAFFGEMERVSGKNVAKSYAQHILGKVKIAENI